MTHKFNVNGHEGYLIVGLFEDGRPGEVFLKMAKEGSTVRGLMDTIGVLTSVALQYGVPLGDLVAKFSGTRFEPLGWSQNRKIGDVTSLVDYVFRWLDLVFAEEDVTDKPSDSPSVAASPSQSQPAAPAKAPAPAGQMPTKRPTRPAPKRPRRRPK